MAEQGCQIVFSDSYGHQTYMMQAAAEYPDVTFVACTGDMAAASTPNTANIFPYTFQSRYVSGVVAGKKLKELMDAGTVTDPYVGYVGAYPYDEVVSGYTAFYLSLIHISFKLVNERLEQVYKGLGEMQTLAVGVGDLKKVLSNVKTRGTLGEIQLEAILSETVSYTHLDVYKRQL